MGVLDITRPRSTLIAAARATCVVSAAVLGTCHVLAASPVAESPPYQSPESFAAAIRDHSSSPVYVLITVVDDTTGQARTGCTEANFLVGAIQREYGLANDTAADANARNMALANTSHVFHFSRPEALANVAFRYSPHDMEVARQLIQPLTDEQLRAGFADRGELQGMSDAAQDARACVLIERGLRVRMADITGKLRLGP